MALSRQQIMTLHGAMEDHASRLGVFEAVNLHEPKSAPQQKGLTVSLWVQSMRPARRASGLSATSYRVEYIARVGLGMIQQDMDAIDPRVMEGASLLMESFSEDFTLGGLVRNVDLLGEHGDPLQWNAGYVPQDGRLYRAVDITVPLIVNDVFDQEA